MRIAVHTVSVVPIRIVVISHERLLLMGLQQLIKSNQSSVKIISSASCCLDAIAVTDKLRPDVVLLDIDIAGENVLEAIPQLSRLRAKILLLTRVQDEPLQDKAILAGAHGVLGKDTSVGMLMMAISKIHSGELWLNRVATGRILSFSHKLTIQFSENPEKRRILSLTDRERRIVLCMLENAVEDARALAARLHISESTLRNHLTAVYEKLGVTNRRGLVAYGHKHNLTSLFG